MSTQKVFIAILSVFMFLGLCHVSMATPALNDAEMSSPQALEEDDLKEWNNQIRREKFDIVLPWRLFYTTPPCATKNFPASRPDHGNGCN
ncbi:hypothetical protein ACFLT2_05960 [Acidobacteriota bacterium]